MATPGPPLTRTYVFCGACFAMGVVYGLFQATPSPGLSIALSSGPFVAVAMWLARDAKQQRVAAVHDAGLLFYITLPLSIPWYALKTRGRSGWVLAGKLYALAFAGLLGTISGGVLGLLRNP